MQTTSFASNAIISLIVTATRELAAIKHGLSFLGKLLRLFIKRAAKLLNQDAFNPFTLFINSNKELDKE